MDTSVAFALGAANRGRGPKVFDWLKAAKLIKERGVLNAAAGLAGDWEWTGGPILRDGKPVAKEDTYTFLASTHATPELDLDGEIVACYRMQSEVPDWSSDTYWPPEALAALSA